MLCSLCGVKPMCAITGMPDCVSFSTIGTMFRPPSSFTAWTPASFMNRTEVWNACSGDAWYEPNGRSATTSARSTAPATARHSGMSSSTVTRSVLS